METVTLFHDFITGKLNRTFWDGGSVVYKEVSWDGLSHFYTELACLYSGIQVHPPTVPRHVHV